VGIGLWIVAGAGAALLARLSDAGRSRILLELFIGISAAALAGLTATALDFGGTREPDWRAGLFTFFAALTAVGVLRLIRLKRS